MLCLLKSLLTLVNEKIFLICTPELIRRDLKTLIVIFPLLILEFPFCTMVIESDIDVVIPYPTVNLRNLTGASRWEVLDLFHGGACGFYWLIHLLFHMRDCVSCIDLSDSSWCPTSGWKSLITWRCSLLPRMLHMDSLEIHGTAVDKTMEMTLMFFCRGRVFIIKHLMAWAGRSLC